MRRLSFVAFALLGAACSPPPRVTITPLPAAYREISLAEDARDVDRVLALAIDRDPIVQARAAQALGRIGDRRATPALLTLARSTEARVAREALFALGLLEPNAGDGACEAYRDALRSVDAQIRAIATEALGKSMRPESFEAVVPILEDADANVRGLAALALAKAAGGRGAAPKLDAAARSVVAKVIASDLDAKAAASARWRELYALAAFADSSSRGALVAATRDRDATTRLFAARGLGKLPDDDATVAARIALTRDPDPRVVVEAALSLQTSSTTAITDALAALLDRPESFVRRAAVKGLGSNANTRNAALLALDRALKDPSPMVRGEAVISRGRLDAVDAAFLSTMSADSAPHVRACAAETVARLPIDEALLHIERALADPNATVAAAAATALGNNSLQLRDATRVRAFVRHALTDPRPMVRENAAQALSGHPAGAEYTKDLDALLVALRESRGEDNSEVRATLLEAVANLKEADRAPVVAPVLPEACRAISNSTLLDALSDPDVSVRAKARLAWKAVLGDVPVPKVAVPPPPTAAIPGVNCPDFAFLRSPRVRVTTTRGAFEIELFADDAPVHSENFLRLAARGQYRGTPWHRIEPQFVAQGGDHLGDGTGSRSAAGGGIRDEINRRPFLRGTVGMPKTDVPDSGGSQLFICHIPTPHLDGRYTAFGQVVKGMEVVDLLEIGDTIDDVEILDDGR